MIKDLTENLRQTKSKISTDPSQLSTEGWKPEEYISQLLFSENFRNDRFTRVYCKIKNPNERLPPEGCSGLGIQTYERCGA